LVTVAHVFCNALTDIDQQGTGAAGRVNVPADFDTIEKAFSGVKTAEKGIK
jgi:hypothetical protein